MSDLSSSLQAQVLDALQQGSPLVIQGGNSKPFLGRPCQGTPLSLREHRGIVSYEPTELVLTARGGTPLQEIEQALAEHQQMLAFEPPHFGDTATLGGTIACNLSGPRRANTGAARDFVLGTRLLNGKGEILHFGGEVMKNVAGYDVSRLLAGAMGSLGVLLEISLKVLPKPQVEQTQVMELETSTALRQVREWQRRPLPISATCYDGNRLYIRLSGNAQAVRQAAATIGGDRLDAGDRFWHRLREQQHGFFTDHPQLWRLSLAAATPMTALPGKCLWEWGGALRWVTDPTDADSLQRFAAEAGGFATLFRAPAEQRASRAFLPAPLLELHKRIKTAFDPQRIFNPGRLHPDC